MGGVSYSQMAVDIVDALLMGIPSAAIAQQINQHYAVEYGKVLNLVETLQNKAIEAENAAMSATSKASYLKSLLYGSSPLGASYKHLLEEANQVEEEAKKQSATAQQLREEASAASVRANELARKSSRTVGQIAAEELNLP